MAGKKSSKRLQGQEDEPSQSEDSEMERQMDAFDSNQPWSQLDDLQNHLFNGSHQVSSPQDMPKKPKKRDRKKQREEQITQYQQALAICQEKNTHFVNPFQAYTLNVNQQEYKKMLNGVVDGTTPPQGVARIVGIKSLRILHQQKLYQQFNILKQFIKDLKLPKQMVDAYHFLLKSQGNVLFRSLQVAYLESTQKNQI